VHVNKEHGVRAILPVCVHPLKLGYQILPCRAFCVDNSIAPETRTQLAAASSADGVMVDMVDSIDWGGRALSVPDLEIQCSGELEPEPEYDYDYDRIN